MQNNRKTMKAELSWLIPRKPTENLELLNSGQAFALSTSEYYRHEISYWCCACDFALRQEGLLISKASKLVDILCSLSTLVVAGE